jgi:hypothetical protein
MDGGDYAPVARGAHGASGVYRYHSVYWMASKCVHPALRAFAIAGVWWYRTRRPALPKRLPEGNDLLQGNVLSISQHTPIVLHGTDYNPLEQFNVGYKIDFQPPEQFTIDTSALEPFGVNHNLGNPSIIDNQQSHLLIIEDTSLVPLPSNSIPPVPFGGGTPISELPGIDGKPPGLFGVGDMPSYLLGPGNLTPGLAGLNVTPSDIFNILNSEIGSSRVDDTPIRFGIDGKPIDLAGGTAIESPIFNTPLIEIDNKPIEIFGAEMPPPGTSETTATPVVQLGIDGKPLEPSSSDILIQGLLGIESPPEEQSANDEPTKGLLGADDPLRSPPPESNRG